jgi:hypothetical protein
VFSLNVKEATLDIFLEEDSYVWFLENCENLTPLQMSAKLGVVEIFQFFINLENVYSFVSTQDGLFDVKLYASVFIMDILILFDDCFLSVSA